MKTPKSTKRAGSGLERLEQKLSAQKTLRKAEEGNGSPLF
jgi:hypothetical protein